MLMVAVREIFRSSRLSLIECPDFDVPKTEDEFGTLSIHQTTNKDGKPLCPSHGVICKNGIYRDYSALLRKIEREKNQASFNKWRGNGEHHGGNYCFQLGGFFLSQRLPPQ
jgi:hypothetical protein